MDVCLLSRVKTTTRFCRRLHDIPPFSSISGYSPSPRNSVLFSWCHSWWNQATISTHSAPPPPLPPHHPPLLSVPVWCHRRWAVFIQYFHMRISSDSSLIFPPDTSVCTAFPSDQPTSSNQLSSLLQFASPTNSHSIWNRLLHVKPFFVRLPARKTHWNIPLDSCRSNMSTYRQWLSTLSFFLWLLDTGKYKEVWNRDIWTIDRVGACVLLVATLLPCYLVPSSRVRLLVIAMINFLQASLSLADIRHNYDSCCFFIKGSNGLVALISAIIDLLVRLAVHGIRSSLLQHHNSKLSVLLLSAFLIVQDSQPYVTTGKTNAFTILHFL